MTEEVHVINQQRIYKLTPESASDKKRKIKIGIAINYSLGLLILSFALINGYQDLGLATKITLVIGFSALLAAGFLYFSKKNSQKIDTNILTIDNNSISVNSLIGNQKLLLTEIVKAEESSRGISLYTKDNLKRKVFIDKGFEDFQSIKEQVAVIAKNNTTHCP